MKFKKVISILCSGILGLNMCTNFCANKPQAFTFDEKKQKYTIKHKDVTILFVSDETESPLKLKAFEAGLHKLLVDWENSWDKDEDDETEFICYHKSRNRVEQIENASDITDSPHKAAICMLNEYGVVPPPLKQKLTSFGYTIVPLLVITGKENLPDYTETLEYQGSSVLMVVTYKEELKDDGTENIHVEVVEEYRNKNDKMLTSLPIAALQIADTLT